MQFIFIDLIYFKMKKRPFVVLCYCYQRCEKTTVVRSAVFTIQITGNKMKDSVVNLHFQTVFPQYKWTSPVTLCLEFQNVSFLPVCRKYREIQGNFIVLNSFIGVALSQKQYRHRQTKTKTISFNYTKI